MAPCITEGQGDRNTDKNATPCPQVNSFIGHTWNAEPAAEPPRGTGGGSAKKENLGFWVVGSGEDTQAFEVP